MAPALAATRHKIDARRLALMKDRATLNNIAPGSLVDHVALQRELVSGRISAVIDVGEPGVLSATSPLYTLPNVLLTSHIAGAVEYVRQRLGNMAAHYRVHVTKPDDPILQGIGISTASPSDTSSSTTPRSTCSLGVNSQASMTR